MEKLEFKEVIRNGKVESCSVYLKSVKLLQIEFEGGKYIIVTWGCDLIKFRYFGTNPNNDLDFIEPYRINSTLDEAKENCKNIISDFTKWLQ